MFKASVQKLFEREGFYSDHPFDSGGATKYGITIGLLASHRGKPVTKLDVMNLTEAEAESIYLESFWKPLRIEEIKNQTLAYCIFDQAVNRGPYAAIKQLQETLNLMFGAKLKIDGEVGNMTIDACNKVSPNKLAFEFILSSQIAYCRLVQQRPTQLAFLVGWIARTQEMLSEIHNEKGMI